MSDFYWRQIQLSRQERGKKFEGARGTVPAKIVSVNGSTTPANRPNMTWIALWGRDENRTQAFNPTSQRAAGDAVLVSHSPSVDYQWQVIGPYYGDILRNENVNASRYASPTHGANHQIPTEDNPGPDPVNIFQPALMPFKATGNGVDFTLAVRPLIYLHEGIRRAFAGSAFDLTGFVPGAGLARYVLVYLDPNFNSLNTVSGSTVPDSPAITPPLPTIPARGYPTAYVRLFGGQTAVVTSRDVLDARSFLAANEAFLRLSGGTMSGNINLADNSFLRPVLRDVAWAADVNSVTGTYTLDMEIGNAWDLTLTGNTTFTFANPATSSQWSEFQLLLRQDGTGGWVVTWPAEVTNSPALNTTLATASLLRIITTDGGSSWLVFIVETGI